MVKVLTVVGYPTCGYYQTAARTAQSIGKANPETFQVNLVPKPANDYRQWVRQFNKTAERHHTSSPAVFIGQDADPYETFVGGNDDFQSYARGEGLVKGGCSVL